MDDERRAHPSSALEMSDVKNRKFQNFPFAHSKRALTPLEHWNGIRGKPMWKNSVSGKHR